jgi:hypothetical protein
MSYYYISNPYNGTEEQREERAQIAAKVCGQLLKKDVHAWSPIVHNHSMMKTYNEFTLEERRTKILDFDFSLLKASKGMIVLKIQGWKDSFGVKAEIELCQRLSIPIKYLNPADLEFCDCPLEILTDHPGESTDEII